MFRKDPGPALPNNEPLGITTSTFHLIQRSHSSTPAPEKCSEIDRKTYWPTISSQTMLKIAELLPFQEVSPTTFPLASPGAPSKHHFVKRGLAPPRFCSSSKSP